MKGKIVAAVALGLVVGLVASSSLKQSEAQGQGEQKKQDWEYKVVAFVVIVGIGDRNVDKHKEQIDKLAAEGWEYVGLLSAGSNSDVNVPQNVPGRPITSGGNVLFRRSKR